MLYTVLCPEQMKLQQLVKPLVGTRHLIRTNAASKKMLQCGINIRPKLVADYKDLSELVAVKPSSMMISK